MKKKILALGLSISLLTPTFASAEFEWAKTAVDFCTERKILSGNEDGDLMLGSPLTREQMAKILADCFGFTKDTEKDIDFPDIDKDSWSYGYVAAIENHLFGGVDVPRKLNPTENVSREEFCATMLLCYGLKNSNLRNPNLLAFNFKDSDKVTAKYKKLLTVAVERGLMSGADGFLSPENELTRAEACSFLYRAISVKEGKLTIDPKDLGVIQSRNSMTGEPEVTLEQAKKWAEKKGATELFIEAADIYWKYGELTGIRPEILYAQSAKETGFGKYGGAVKPEQNNFAGIKVYGATGDRTEDHETFETQDDGVRGHFNHMSAYLGLTPIGETHGRYKSVSKMPWSGKVKLLEELGGKWCPDLYYGFSILHDYIEPMKGI